MDYYDLLEKINKNKCNIFMAKNAVDQTLTDESDLNLSCVYTIQTGAAVSEECETDFKDNSSEDNISERNPNYCEGTAIYWIWKNVSSEYVGLCHYRRIFELTDEKLNDFIDDSFDVIMPEPLFLYPNIEEQYKRYHYAADWDIMMNVLHEMYPEYYETAKVIFKQEVFYSYCMGIYKKTYFDKYCEWLFPILDEVYKRSKQKNDIYQNRYIAFLMERLHGVFFFHNKENLKYEHVKVKLLNSSDKYLPEVNKDELTSEKIIKKIQSLFDIGRIEKARDFLKNNAEYIEKNEQLQIISYLYDIYELEKKVQESNIFTCSDSLDELIEIYTKLKFLIRRYDFDFVSGNELYKFIKNYNISYVAIIYISNLFIINKMNVLNDIAIDLFNENMMEYSINIMLYLCNNFPGNNQILYTISFMLHYMGEYENALSFVNKISVTNESIEELKLSIKGGLLNNG